MLGSGCLSLGKGGSLQVLEVLFEHKYFVEIVLTIATWVVALILIRINGLFLRRLRDELAVVSVEDRTLKAIDQIFDTVIIIIAVLVSLYVWGVDQALYTALTTIGVIGIIIGFAVKDVASNLLAGIFLIFSKDFLVGDHIRVKDMEGTVESIKIRTTSVRRPDRVLIIIPNSVLVNEAVVDFSATKHRRVDLPVVVRNGSDVDRAMALLRRLAEDNPMRSGEEETQVVVQGFDTDSVLLELRFWVDRADFIEAKSSMNGRIDVAFRKEGIEYGQTTTVSLLENDSGQ